MSRFNRQKILPDFGEEGQQKLSDAKALVIGAGGLGCPALLYMAAAGVGTIGIADGDRVDESNLNRQTLFGQDDIGEPKAETAANILKEKYPDINFQTIPHYLAVENTLDVLEGYDLVLDGSDNFETRYMMSDACALLGIPHIMGAIYQYEGQVAVFNIGKDPVSYRDIYPNPPKTSEIPNCSEAGVFGVLPGIIGTLQATEAVKIFSGVGEVLMREMLFYNLKTCEFYKVEMKPVPASKKNIPKNEAAFRKRGYNIRCGMTESISWKEAMKWPKKTDNFKLIDIREPGEVPAFNASWIENIPMSVLRNNPEQLKSVESIILFCKLGKRSKNLAEKLKKRFPQKKIVSIKGGILDPSSPLNVAIN